jgi:hypothetical protein
MFAAGRSEVDVVFHHSTWWSNGRGISRTNGGSLNLGHGEGPGEHLVNTAEYCPLIEIKVLLLAYDSTGRPWMPR